MSEPVRHGTLGPQAAARLRALSEQIARLEEERTILTLVIAEAQGFVADGPIRFAWDFGDESRWRTEPA